MFKIKRVNPQNAEHMAELARLHAETLPGVELPTGAAWWWIAWKGRRVAGFACLTGSRFYANTGYLSRCGVLEEFRGHGLQRRLITARLRQAKKLGWTALVSDTSDAPESAKNLQRAGFKEFIPDRPWALAKSLYWRRDI